MISFYNDYNEIGHPDLINEFIKLKDEKYIGYSEDVECQKAKEVLKEKLNRNDVDIHFVHSGTMANILGILFSANRYESVISANTGHIVNTENGAIEASGLQIIQVPENNGKVTVEEIEKVVKRNSKEFCTKPGVVYISNATEIGTIYKKSELEALYNCCKKNGLYLFLDGARIGSAIMSKASDLKFEDIPKFTDIFTIGGNKNGFIFGEAIVIVNDKIKTGFERRLIKQRGALLAKGFLLGIQFRKMFEENLFFDNAKNATDMANILSDIFIQNGIKLVNETEANLIFVDLPKNIHLGLSKKYKYEVIKDLDNIVRCRFVTSWNTKLDEV